MQHLMFDIETTGKSAGCRVLSIAVVRASDNASFMTNLDLERQEIAGFWDDPDTLAWWSDKPDIWRQCTENAIDVDVALITLGDWVKAAVGDQDWLAWCQGASFDFPILDALYQRFMIDPPWQYWQKRCSRTLFDLACVTKPPADHNPLNDALGQTAAFNEAMHIISRAHANS